MSNHIILIPGIQGTTLHNTNEKDFVKVWSGIKKYFVNIHKLELQSDGIHDKGAETLIERADVEDLAYSEIINYLRSLGYRVYIFGYDWRKSNIESAKQLRKYVKRLSDKLNNNKFIFLTHSMGALVLSSFFRLLPRQEIQKHLHRAVMTVPPFLGSVEAYFNLYIGRSKLLNTSDDIRKVIRTFPSIYELAAVYDKVMVFEDGVEKNIFDFDACWQHFKNPDREKTIKKNQLMRKKVKKLQQLRSDGKNLIYDFGKLGEKTRKKILILLGTGEETREKIFVKKKSPNGALVNFFDFEHFPKTEGDGTVHIKSASIFAREIDTIAVKSFDWETWLNSHMIMKDWHSFFLNNGRVQNIIKRFIACEDPGKLPENWYGSLLSTGVEKL